LVTERLEAAEDVAVARDKAAAPLLDVAKAPEAVVFEVKEPVAIVEGLLSRSG
jgi:hypothetical protein